MPGVIPSAEFNAQLVRTVQAEMRRVGYEQPTGTPPRHVRRSTHVGFLTSAIAAATDARLAWEFQPTGTFNIWQHDAAGALADTSDELIVYSKRDSAFVTGTYCEVEYKAGVWQLIDANCAATSL
jgi:hypothetical protein